MAIVKVAKTTQEHIDSLKSRLRQVDEDQCWALACITAAFGLQYSFDRARFSQVALLDGVPALCWGVSSDTVFSREGTPWFVGTEAIHTLGRKIARYSKVYMKQMFNYFDRLEGWVDARNTVSLRWLKWCGFNIEEAVPFGPEGKDCHRIWIESRGN